MIRLKHILTEQDVQSQNTSAVNSKQIAKQIYDSKGLLWDDPAGIVASIKQIKTADQFKKVNQELMTLTGGRDLATYLKSFLDKSDKQTWVSVLSYLKKQFKGNEVEILYPVGKIYFNLMNDKTNPRYEGIGREYISPDFEQWWKEQSVKIINGISISPLSTIGQVAYENRHEIATIISIALLFVPVVGWFASAGVGLTNAGMYYKEGDSKQAGIEAIFALLPGVGKIGSTIGKTIPSIGKLGAEGMARLGRKLATSKSPLLTNLEMLVIKDMSKYKDIIKTDLTEYFKARVKNEAARIAKNATRSKKAQVASNWLNKFAGGGIVLGKLGTQTAADIGLTSTAVRGWDKIYNAAGLNAQPGGRVVLDPEVAAYTKNPAVYKNEYDDLMK